MRELDNAIKRLKENADIKELPYIIADIIKKNCSKDEINLILQNLKEYDNVNPSEALKSLEKVWNFNYPINVMGFVEFIKIGTRCFDDMNTIKQALIELKRLDILLRLPSEQSSSHFTYKDKNLVCMQEIQYNKLITQERDYYKRILNIINEKNLFDSTHKYIFDFSKTKNYESYCNLFKAYRLDEKNKLTEEEFNLLKQFFEKNIQN